jgi:hypothetical protein
MTRITKIETMTTQFSDIGAHDAISIITKIMCRNENNWQKQTRIKNEYCLETDYQCIPNDVITTRHY